MPTIWNVTGVSGRVNVTQTHRTIRSGNIFNASVPVDFQMQRQAHVADLAMEEIVSTANAAYATAIAMVLISVLIVE